MLKRRPLPIHPNAQVTDNERKALSLWLCDQRRKRKPTADACFGLWKVLAPQFKEQNRIQNADKFRAAGKAINNSMRKRPEWCTQAKWDAWRAYTRMCCAGIPLHVYVDPIKRAEYRNYLGKATPRKMAEDLLKKKGLYKV